MRLGGRGAERVLLKTDQNLCGTSSPEPQNLQNLPDWVLRNGAEGPFRTFQERILADTIQNVLLFKADVTYT